MFGSALKDKKFIPILLITSLFYFAFSIYLSNGDLVKDTILGNFPLVYKTNLLFALLLGAFTAISKTTLIILVVLSILTGLNFALIVNRLRYLKSLGRYGFVFGSGSLFSIAGAGCTSCGLPVISFLGLTGSVSGLPFKGMEFSIISMFALLISIFFILRSNIRDCKVNYQH